MWDNDMSASGDVRLHWISKPQGAPIAARRLSVVQPAVLLARKRQGSKLEVQETVLKRAHDVGKQTAWYGDEVKTEPQGGGGSQRVRDNVRRWARPQERLRGVLHGCNSPRGLEFRKRSIAFAAEESKLICLLVWKPMRQYQIIKDRSCSSTAAIASSVKYIQLEDEQLACTLTDIRCGSQALYSKI